MNKLMPIVKNTILIYAAVQATYGLATLAKETTTLVIDRVKN